MFGSESVILFSVLIPIWLFCSLSESLEFVGLWSLWNHLLVGLFNSIPFLDPLGFPKNPKGAKVPKDPNLVPLKAIKPKRLSVGKKQQKESTIDSTKSDKRWMRPQKAIIIPLFISRSRGTGHNLHLELKLCTHGKSADPLRLSPDGRRHAPNWRPPKQMNIPPEFPSRSRKAV